MSAIGRPRPWLRDALVFAALAALAGCATAPQTRELISERPGKLPERVMLTGVPFFPQERYMCGPAALATVLADLGRDVRPDDLVGEVYVPARQGSLRPEMRAAIRARGLVAYPLAPELRAILREIAAGRPVLVMQNLGLSWWPRWHYAVAVGYDLPEREIILRSGTMRRRVTDLSTFERTWARVDYWAQVVVPPGDPPATARVLPWLEAVSELALTGHPEAARTGYRAATRRWPDARLAWMARGNAAYAAGDYEEARAAFGRAVELAPRNPAGWNNLAYALAAGGCGGAALKAARCAVALASGAATARDTLRDLRRRDLTRGAACPIPACPVVTAASSASRAGADGAPP